MKFQSVAETAAAVVQGIAFFIVGLLILFLAAAAWDNPFQFDVFAGDDVRCFQASEQGLSAYSKVLRRFNKFRPVTALALATATQVAKTDYTSIAAIGLLIKAANGMALFWIVYRLIGLPFGLSACVAVAGILNRFSVSYMHEWAIMEGLGIFTFLMIVAAMLRYGRRPTPSSALILVGLFLVIIHIHERYTLLGAAIACLAVVTFRSSRVSAIVLVAGEALAVALNFAIKAFWLRSPILVGATSKRLEFDALRTVEFLGSGAANLFGINRGPAYLSAEDVAQSPLWVQIVSITTAILSLVIIVLSARAIWRRGPGSARAQQLAILATSTVLIGSLLFSASVTFRQEYRWLYPAFLGFLCVLAYCTTIGPPTSWAPAALALLLLLSISRDFYLSRRYDHLAAYRAYKTANDLFDVLSRVPDIRRKEAVVIYGEPPPSAKWAFLDQTFAQFYRFPRFTFVGNAEPVAHPNAAVLRYTGGEPVIVSGAELRDAR